MKILLILPAAEHVRVTRQKPAVPPRNMLRFSVLPLTIVAALTPAQHDVRIVDENVEPLDFDDDATLIGISFMTAIAHRAYEIAREFRSRGKTVVGGGYHPTLLPADASPHFDALVLGDAEGAWQQLLHDYETGRLQALYVAPWGPLHTPVPRRDLLARTAKHYATIHAVQTGRGCNHGCRYCSIAAFHQRASRRRQLSAVLDELRSIPRDFIFVDDNIVSCREFALALFHSMQPLGKRWVGQCSIEAADDPELLAAMREAGCRGLFVGIETIDDDNLAAMDKQFNQSRSYERRIAAFHTHGIGVFAGMMVGLDRDGPDVFERVLRFLARCGVDGLQLNILTPLPGTQLFDDMDRASRITTRDWSLYDFRHVVFRPAGMTAVQLQSGADWLYIRFYRLDHIVLRFFRTLFSSGWVPAWLGLRLGLTYRYDNRREGLTRRNSEAAGVTGQGVALCGPAVHLAHDSSDRTAVLRH